jgi:ASC-1-like (ASCH) protein
LGTEIDFSDICIKKYQKMNKDTFVDSEWFDCMKNGKKIIEGRPGNKIFYTGPITWVNKQTNERFDCVILQVVRYKTFAHMITAYGLDKVLPTRTDSTVDQAISDVYYKINAGQPDSYETLEKQHGVLALVFVPQFK